MTLSYDVSLIPGILLYHMMFLLYQVYYFIICCFIYSLDDVISYLVLQEQVNCHNGVYYNNANLH